MAFVPAELETRSASLQEQLRTAELAAITPVTVWIQGETGCAKSQLAKAIATGYFSQPAMMRYGADWSFITLDARTLKPGLLKQVLFDADLNQKQTDSDQQLFAVTQFRGGVPFDENNSDSQQLDQRLNNKRAVYLTHVGKLPLALQHELAAQLNVLDVRQQNPKADSVISRLIVSHSQPLHASVQAGEFDQSLYYRLNAVPLEVTPLCQRIEDLEHLIQLSFSRLVKRYRLSPPTFSDRAMKSLRKYPWPGNLDELDKLCERLLLLLPGQTVDLSNLPGELVNFERLQTAPAYSLPPGGVDLQQLESDLLCQALENARGNKSHAARLLGLTRDTFLYRLKKFGIRA